MYFKSCGENLVHQDQLSSHTICYTYLHNLHRRIQFLSSLRQASMVHFAQASSSTCWDIARLFVKHISASKCSVSLTRINLLHRYTRLESQHEMGSCRRKVLPSYVYLCVEQEFIHFPQLPVFFSRCSFTLTPQDL